MITGRILFRSEPAIADTAWNSVPAWTFGWTVALLASIALALFGEASGSRRNASLQAAAFGLGCLAWLGYGETFLSPSWTVAALCVAILLAPAPRRTEQELWSFDARLVGLLLFAVVAATTFVLGSIAIKTSVEYLFDIRSNWRSTERILVVGYCFALPFVWCGLLPRPDVPALASDHALFRSAAALGALLAAVLGILVGVLHVYALKIAIDGALPKNQVGWIVSTTLLMGTATWVLSAGEGGQFSAFRRSFRRFWFPLTIIPVVLLAIAVVKRIDAYGVTADRYVLCVAAAASFAFLALFAMRLRPPTIRSALVAALVVFMIAAIGPFSQPAVVSESQIARLKALLAREGVLVDGRLAASESAKLLRDPAKSEASSMLRAIEAAGAIERVSELAPGRTVANFDDASRLIGVRYPQ